jgi:hypothetical protein
MKFHVVI